MSPPTSNDNCTSNENFFKNEKGRDGDKVQKQDGMNTIIVNYSDKIIRK